MKKFNLFVPYCFKILIIKNKISVSYNILLINKNKKINFKIKNLKLINIDKWNNSIVFKLNNSNKYSINKEINLFNNFLKSLNVYYFNKIKFKGKGFRIKSFKKNKIIKFFFGKSHKTYILLKKIKKIRINKYKYLLYGINKNKLKNINNYINKIKKYNVYTLRGLRFSKQIIYKRKGKKGTYI